mgnify:CR=1 FL=1
MAIVPQPTQKSSNYPRLKPALRRFQDSTESKTERASYIDVNDALGHIRDIVGLKGKGLAVRNAIRETEARNQPPYQPFTRAHVTIGKRMAGMRSDDDDRIGKTAGLALDDYFNRVQPEIHKLLFERWMVDEEGQVLEEKPDGKWFHYTYTDHELPAAQEALRRARNHPDWKRANGIERQEILRAACEWAIENLIPDCTAEPKERESQRMECEAYAAQTEDQIFQMLKARLDKIANEYGDPERAESAGRRISRKAGDLAGSFHRISYRRKNPLAQLLGITPSLPTATLSPAVDQLDADGFLSSSVGLSDQPDGQPEPAEAAQVSPPRREEGVILLIGANVAQEPANTPQVSAESEKEEGANFAPTAPLISNEDSNLTFQTPPQLLSNPRWLWVMRYILNKGWAVIPNHYQTDNGACSCGRAECVPGGKLEKSIGKHPVTPNGVDGATKDLATLAAYWMKDGRYNVGIATGPESGVDAVDFDGKKGGKLVDEWTAKGWIDDDCLQANTPTEPGRHVFIEHIPGLKNGVKPKDANGNTLPFDIRTARGQVIVEGSKTPNGYYRWRGASGSAAEPLSVSPEFRAYLLSVAGKDEAKPESEAKSSRNAVVVHLDEMPAVEARGRIAPNYSLCKELARLKGDGTESSADMRHAIWSLSHGFSEDEAAALLARDTDLSRKTDPSGYLQLTVTEARKYVEQVRSAGR